MSRHDPVSPAAASRRFVAALALLASASLFAFVVRRVATKADESRWQSEALETRIVRDDWGIAHVHGKTDADAVFGMIYAQAEDDFNRSRRTT